jgi:hypothetical protein
LWAGPGKIDILTRSEGLTSADHPTIIGVETILHSIVLYIHIPAIDEVGMKAKACGITIRENELSTSRLINLICKVKDSVRC